MQALLTPDLSLATLSDARAVVSDDGFPSLKRTTRLVEAPIVWRGERWLLSMPLAAAVVPRLARTAAAVRPLRSRWLTEYRILPGELRWTDASGEVHTQDLVLQHLPAGYDFDQALLSERPERLLAALAALEAELRRIGFTHGNLKASNLRWTEDRFVVLRYADARVGEPLGADAGAFESLRRRIREAAVPCPEVRDVAAPYSARRELTGHRWCSHEFEGLVCVEDETGFGYVDADNRPVIAAQFCWAGDFREGRAEVETPAGMGLIDRTGRYVIPPEFEIVDYDPAASLVRVRKGGLWALFDYSGRRLTDFGAIDAMTL